MIDIWYKQLGFHNNPLSIKPAIFTDSLMGLKERVDEISYSILSNKNVFIVGEYGEGKTTILKKLINDFGGKKQVIYFSCNRIDHRINVKKLLNGRFGFWGKLLDLRPRNMILLLDEAQALSKKDYEKLMNYHTSGFFRSIVLVSSEYPEKNLPDSFKKTLKQIKLKTITEEDAVKLIRKRVGNLPLLPNDMIRLLFKKSEKNVRMLLKNTEEVCKYAVNYGEEKITGDLVEEVLEKKESEAMIKTEPQEERLFIKKETPVEVAKPVRKLKKKVVGKKEAVKEKPKVEEDGLRVEDVIDEIQHRPKRKEKPVGIEIIEVREDEIEEEKPKIKVTDEDFDEELEEELAALPPEEVEEKQRKKKVRPQTAEEALNKPTEDLLGEEHYY